MTQSQAEPRAWYTLYLAYSTPRAERTGRQQRLAAYGICWGIDSLHWDSFELTWDDNLGMKDTIHKSMPMPTTLIYGERNLYFCVYSPANDLLRADYCYLQYLIAGGE